MPGAVNGIGPRDADLVLRVGATEGNLTADETDTKTLPNGVPVTKPMSVVVLIPQKSSLETGGGDTMRITAKITTTNKKVEVTHTDLVKTGDTYPQVVILPLPPVPGPDLTLSVTYDVTDGGTDGVNFGEVQAWVEGGSQVKVPKT